MTIHPRADGDQGGRQHRGRDPGWLGAHLARNRVGAETAAGADLPHRTDPAGLGQVARTGRRRPPTGRSTCCSHRDGSGPNRSRRPASPSVFRFDPPIPPTIGGRLLTRDSGYRDDTGWPGDDVLSFTTSTSAVPMCVCGPIPSSSSPDTDNPHFDVFVRLSEVDGRDAHARQRRLRPVQLGARRTDPLELDPVAHRFSVGSRLRLIVAGGCHHDSPATWVPASRCSPGGRCGRPPTPCVTATAQR